MLANLEVLPYELLEFESWEDQVFSLLNVVQTSSRVNPSSYPMGAETSFPGGKAAGPWSWPLNSNWYQGQESVALYIHSPISLHGVVLN
jgi:hypothetical protein